MNAKHSILGPSGADRWINCPGSVQLSAGIQSPTSFAAAEGSVAHAVAEDLHTGKIDSIKLLARVGEKVEKDGHDVEITEEMVHSAIEYHDFCVAEIKELEKTNKRAPVHHKTESRVKALSIHPNVWGTADKVIYRKGDRLVVIDYKYGKGKAVEVEENAQMSCYAVGVMDSEAGWAFNSVDLVIFQPRAPHVDGGERRWKTTPAWLKGFAKRAGAAASETMNPNAKIEAGSHCQWCPAKARCPELHGQAQKRAMVAFDAIPGAKKETSMEARLPEVRLLSDAKLVEAKRWEDAVNSFFEAVNQTLRERLEGGATIGGVKLVRGRSLRKWTDEKEVVDKFSTTVGDKLWERKILTPAKLEKIVGKKAGVDALTYKPEGKKSVALDSDPRPAVQSSAQDAFDKIEDPCPECAVLGPEACPKHAAPNKKNGIWPVD